MARPRIEIDVEEVERLASRGLTHAQICSALGISPDTLSRRKKDTQAVADALERGRARGIGRVADALFEEAIKGNVSAQKFFLKARGGWTEPSPRSFWVDPFKDDQQFREMHAFKRQVTAYLRAARDRTGE